MKLNCLGLSSTWIYGGSPRLDARVDLDRRRHRMGVGQGLRFEALEDMIAYFILAKNDRASARGSSPPQCVGIELPL